MHKGHHLATPEGVSKLSRKKEVQLNGEKRASERSARSEVLRHLKDLLSDILPTVHVSHVRNRQAKTRSRRAEKQDSGKQCVPASQTRLVENVKWVGRREFRAYMSITLFFKA